MNIRYTINEIRRARNYSNSSTTKLRIARELCNWFPNIGTVKFVRFFNKYAGSNYNACGECGSIEGRGGLLETPERGVVCLNCLASPRGRWVRCHYSDRAIGRSLAKRLSTGGYIHPDYAHNYHTCPDCSSLTPNGDTYRTHDGRYICPNCRGNYMPCPDCGDLYPTEDRDDWTYVEDLGYAVCDNCISQPGYHQRDDRWYSPQYRYTSRNLRNYSTKVEEIFDEEAMFLFADQEPDTDIFLGVELEVNAREYRGEAINELHRLAGSWQIYKRDSSLNSDNGFEIVSVPCTLAYHKSKWPAFIQQAKTHVSAWEDPRTGMHVHISRDAFSPLQLGRFITFINEPKNATLIRSFAKRDFTKHLYCASTRYAKISDAKWGTDKYHHHTAVNLSNHNTVEIRIFKASVNAKTVLRNLEFVHSLHAFCAEASNRQLTPEAYAAFIGQGANAPLYSRVLEHLITKGFMSYTQKLPRSLTETDGENDGELLCA